jgi:peroxiredoxin
MANNLTGDFDVVAQFPVASIDRLLAAMHRCERFPHSLSARVDDTPHPGPNTHPSVLEVVDAFGSALADAGRVGRPTPHPGPLAATSAVHAGLGLLVNSDRISGTLELPPIVPSHLAGVAQVQLGPPSVSVPDGAGARLTGRMPLRARYKADGGTARIAEFIQGELVITAPINQVVSQTGVSAIEIDIKGVDVSIDLSPTWSSTPLTAADRAGVRLLLANALRTSFLPSNAQLPERVKHLQVKTLAGSGGIVAALLDMGPSRGAAASVTQAFTTAGDDFALGVGRDFVLAAFEPVLTSLRTAPIEPIPVSAPLLGSGKYTVTVTSAAADLQAGKLVMTVKGNAAGNRWWTPNFGFTARLEFALVADGDTVRIAPGAVSVDTTSTLVDTLAKSKVENGVRRARDTALSGASAGLSTLLSANLNLGKMLKSLLNAARAMPGQPPLPEVFLLLWYNSVELRPEGIVLHGSLAVTGWPTAHVEYEPVPPPAGPPPVAGALPPTGPDFSALKAWIPGGVIERFEWKALGQTQAFVDPHRFVLRAPEPGLEVASATAAMRVLADAAPSADALHAYSPLCLTIVGSRVSAWGPITRQPVSGSICGYGTFPVLEGAAGVRAGAAMVALTRAGANGLVEVTGHAPAEIDRTGRGVPNRVIHFADDASVARLDMLAQAVRESGRTDAATAVVAVLTAKQLAGALHATNVVYADGEGPGGTAWRRAFGLGESRGATTLLVNARGEVTWRHEGPVDGAALAAALRKGAAPGRAVPRTLKAVNVRLGRQAPNFLFELAPGHSLTLRKLAGRAALLVFWRSTAPASLQAVRALQERHTHAKPARDERPRTIPVEHPPLVLAVNDGEPPEVAKRAAAAYGFTATLVLDPERSISAAYGVGLWPTTIALDAQGAATSISYGLDDDDGHRGHEQTGAAS